MSAASQPMARFARMVVKCSPLMGLSCAGLPGILHAETKGGVAVSASTGFDSNPFLSSANNREVASFRLEVAPSVSLSDEVSNLQVQARAEHIEYLGKFSSVQNLSTTVTGLYRVDARTQISANFGISSGISLTDFLDPPTLSALPDAPVFPNQVVNDITVLGRQTRRTSVFAGGGVTFQPSEYDQISLSSDVNLQRYRKNSGLFDYDFSSQSISYSRRINDTLSLGTIFETSTGDFKRTPFGDVRTLSPRLVVRARLSEQLDLSATAGASFTSVDTVQGNKDLTSFAGSSALCYRDVRQNFCLNGQRQLLPTAIGDVRNQTSIGTNYSIRLSSRDTFRSNVNYSTASAPIGGISGKFESVRIDGRLERRLKERSQMFVAAGYVDSSGGVFGSRSNYQAVVGITVRFGRQS